jgi:O-antigen/teichoic acid export membrane protein
MISSGEAGPAKIMAHTAMRTVFGLMPFAAMVAGSAPQVVTLFFGRNFGEAAPLLSLLIFGAVAFVMISVSIAIMTAAGAPLLTLVVSAPLIPIAVVGHLISIPRLGSIGAASVTTVCAVLGAVACIVVVHRTWAIHPPAGTLGRSVLISMLAYGMSVLWPASGLMVVVKLLVIAAVIVAAFVALRELSAQELADIRAYFGSRPQPAHIAKGFNSSDLL